MPRPKAVRWHPPEIRDADCSDLYPDAAIAEIVSSYLVPVKSQELGNKLEKKLRGILGVMRLGFLQKRQPSDRNAAAAAAEVDKALTTALGVINKLDRKTLRLLQEAAGRDRRYRARLPVEHYKLDAGEILDRHGETYVSNLMTDIRAARRWTRTVRRDLGAPKQSGRPERTVERHALRQLLSLWQSVRQNRVRIAAGSEHETEFPRFEAFAEAALAPMLRHFGVQNSVAAITREEFDRKNLIGTALGRLDKA